MTVALRPVTDALQARLDAAIGVPVFTGDRPKDVAPALVVRQVDGGAGYFRDLPDSHSGGMFAWQVTCVGGNWEQAAWLRDETVEALTSQPPAGVIHATCVSQGDTRPDRDGNPDLWVSTPVFHMAL